MIFRNIFSKFKVFYIFNILKLKVFICVFKYLFFLFLRKILSIIIIYIFSDIYIKLKIN